MALNWDWKESCGTLTVSNRKRNKDGWTDEWEDMEVKLYQGNAWLIMLHEWKEDNEDYWEMFSFFVDEAHMKNCLGLSEGHENMFLSHEKWQKLKKLSLIKDKNRYTNKIVKAFKKAIPELEVVVSY